LDLASFQLLFSKLGQEALAAAGQLQPKEADFLRHFQNLEKQFPKQIAQADLETAILRKEAQKKFPQAEKMYFTREALEQANPHQVSSYRTVRFLEFKKLVDLAGSIGSDPLNMGCMGPPPGSIRMPCVSQWRKPTLIRWGWWMGSFLSGLAWSPSLGIS
jgi:hypothetical protein